jgi:putative ABC transport system permease protein
MTDPVRDRPGASAAPPRAARALLRRVVPRREAEVVDGELLEGFRRRLSEEGDAVARLWYWRQVRGFVLRAISVRASTLGEEGDVMPRFDDLRADLRWALRSLRKRPTFTLVALATLALGIGANSAIFTLVSAHFFEPLPYEDPDDLVLVWETGQNNREVNTVAPGNYYSWREQAESFVDIAAYNVDFATLSGDGPAERVDASLVAPHFFDLLGASPMIGAGFGEGAGPFEVVLSYSLWIRRYGGDRSVVGRDIRIDGRSHTVLGVMPPSFRQPERSLTWQTTELWRPLLLDDQRDDRGSRYLRTIARRKPGVTFEQAREEMTLLGQRLSDAYPEANRGRAVLVRSLHDYFMGSSRDTLLMLLAAGVAVLLIVCANVANLTLARGEERRREFAVRAALGSGRTRLLGQVIVEGVVLALFGAGLGTALVYAGGGILQSIQTRYFSALVDVSVDWWVIGFTTVVAIGAGVVFGIPLARAASRPELRAALVEGGERSGEGSGAGTTRNLLIVGQVGLATTLLVVATLLSRSFNELVNVPPGFEPGGVVTFAVTPPRATYPDAEAITRYHRELLARVEAIPGVAQAGLVSDLMFTTENMNATFAIEGRETNPDDPPRAEFHVVLPEYFRVLEIPVLAGELPDGWETADEPPVIVNERMEAIYWPEGDALGARFSFDWMEGSAMRVVAVVGDVLDDGYDAVADPAFFLPFAAMPRARMSYVIRAAGDPAELMDQLREAVRGVDPDIPAGNLALLEGMMTETAARPRAASLIGMTFAVIALLVSAAGIYGVLSYAVQTRTREIGIRAALGASSGQLVSMVMGHSTRLVVVGLVLGTIGALLAGRYLSSLLFGVRVWDPPSLFGAALVLGAVGTLAAWIPARRAIAIDPREALRAD